MKSRRKGNVGAAFSGMLVVVCFVLGPLLIFGGLAKMALDAPRRNKNPSALQPPPQLPPRRPQSDCQPAAPREREKLMQVGVEFPELRDEIMAACLDGRLSSSECQSIHQMAEGLRIIQMAEGKCPDWAIQKP